MNSPSHPQGRDQPAAVRILLVHGTGRPEDLDEPGDAWADPWIARLTEVLVQDDPGLVDPPRAPVFEILTYRNLIAADFEADPPGPEEFSHALELLGWSSSRHPAHRMFRQSRGMDARAEALRWTAGMIARWSRKPDLRAALRAAVARRIAAPRPDVIVAQSLGSLICYDAFVHYSPADLGHRPSPAPTSASGTPRSHRPPQPAHARRRCDRRGRSPYRHRPRSRESHRPPRDPPTAGR